MGRLASTYRNRQIVARIPYTIHGELTVAASTSGSSFPEATFLHNVEKPFEIHGIRVHVVMLNGSSVPIFETDAGNDQFARLTISDTAANESLTKVAQRVSGLVEDNSKTWNLEEPYTIESKTGLQITADNTSASNSMRIQVTLVGYLLKLG